MRFSGGLGSSPNAIDGGDGGEIVLTGGEGRGGRTDKGGDLLSRGGRAYAGTGGYSEQPRVPAPTSSGSIVMETSNAGKIGISGFVSMRTGTSSFGQTDTIPLLLRFNRWQSWVHFSIRRYRDTGDGGHTTSAGKTTDKASGGYISSQLDSVRRQAQVCSQHCKFWCCRCQWKIDA